MIILTLFMSAKRHKERLVIRTSHGVAPPDPLEQAHPELRLEVVDLPPQRRLRDAQLCGGAAEGSRIGDGDEVPEMMAGFGGWPHRPAGRTPRPAAFRYAPGVSRRTPVAAWMRRSVQPN
jgi:hypothetical protein